MDDFPRLKGLTRRDGAAAPSLFERALAALPDAVLLTGADRKVRYANPAFAAYWAIPQSLMESGDEEGMLRHVSGQLVDPDGFVREVERLHPTSESSQDEIHFNDGRVFSRRSVPFEEDGIFQARIWIFTDITEARRASVDALTELPNRRAYSREFPGYMAAPADGFLRSVALMDVDNFKKYNDRYGHAAGDEVLRRIGALLPAKSANPDDLVFRVGGEEFLMAIRSRGALAAHDFFEALRGRIAALRIPHGGNPPHNVVTASFGVGLFDGPRGAAEAFEIVDAALYEAKTAGRNKVCVASIKAPSAPVGQAASFL